jgi:hypothetical protein
MASWSVYFLSMRWLVLVLLIPVSRWICPVPVISLYFCITQDTECCYSNGMVATPSWLDACSNESRPRTTQSLHLLARMNKTNTTSSPFFLLCLETWLFLLPYCFLRVLAASGSGRFDVASLRPTPCHCCRYRSLLPLSLRWLLFPSSCFRGDSNSPGRDLATLETRRWAQTV